MLSIIFGYSKYYVDSLSENVRRGYRTKIQAGWLPGRAPLGYLNDKESKTIIADPDRFSLIQRMWQLMITGAYSPRRIWEIATLQWGLRTVPRKRVGGSPLTLSAVYRILTNPFYAGVIPSEGKMFVGKHQSMITLDDFEKVQQILRRPGRPRKTGSFAYTGMIRCGECGFTVTAEEKTNRFGSLYTYYHCSKRRMDIRCRQRYISLADLERQMLEFLGKVSLPDQLYRWASTRMDRTLKAQQEEINAQRQSLIRAQTASARELENLTKLRIRDLLTDEEFVKQRQEIELQRIGLAQRLDILERNQDRFEPMQTLISFNHRLVSRFQSGDLQKRRYILNVVGSNLVLKDQKLSIDARKPFRIWSQASTFSEWGAYVQDVRTFVSEQSQGAASMISSIRQLLDELKDIPA